MRDRHADLGRVAIEHVLAMRGRALPALDERVRELGGREAHGAQFPADVLGDEAIVVAVRLGAILGMAPVGGMVEAVGAREEQREIARRVGEPRLDRDALERMLAP